MFFRRALKGKNVSLITANGAGLTGTGPTVTAAMATATNGALGVQPLEGGMYQRVTGDDRRSTTNTNDLRGKILRIKVKDTDDGGRLQQGRHGHRRRRLHRFRRAT